MARSPVSSVALLCLVVVALSSRRASAFTISLAPLLTARLGLAPFGSSYVASFQAPRSASTGAAALAPTSSAKPSSTPSSARQFKFEYDDIRMLSGCKSECMELIYARSLDRGFGDASA